MHKWGGCSTHTQKIQGGKKPSPERKWYISNLHDAEHVLKELQCILHLIWWKFFVPFPDKLLEIIDLYAILVVLLVLRKFFFFERLDLRVLFLDGVCATPQPIPDFCELAHVALRRELSACLQVLNAIRVIPFSELLKGIKSLNHRVHVARVA